MYVIYTHRTSYSSCLRMYSLFMHCVRTFTHVRNYARVNGMEVPKWKEMVEMVEMVDCNEWHFWASVLKGCLQFYNNTSYMYAQGSYSQPSA